MRKALKVVYLLIAVLLLAGAAFAYLTIRRPRLAPSSAVRVIQRRDRQRVDRDGNTLFPMMPYTSLRNFSEKTSTRRSRTWIPCLPSSSHTPKTSLAFPVGLMDQGRARTRHRAGSFRSGALRQVSVGRAGERGRYKARGKGRLPIPNRPYRAERLAATGPSLLLQQQARRRSASLLRVSIALSGLHPEE